MQNDHQLLCAMHNKMASAMCYVLKNGLCYVLCKTPWGAPITDWLFIFITALWQWYPHSVYRSCMWFPSKVLHHWDTEIEISWYLGLVCSPPDHHTCLSAPPDNLRNNLVENSENMLASEHYYYVNEWMNECIPITNGANSVVRKNTTFHRYQIMMDVLLRYVTQVKDVSFLVVYHRLCHRLTGNETHSHTATHDLHYAISCWRHGDHVALHTCHTTSLWIAYFCRLCTFCENIRIIVRKR